jgi:epoxyqueuosine reductase QueG
MNQPLLDLTTQEPSPRQIDSALLRDIAFAAGADDLGFVSMDDPALDDQRADILAAFPFARTLISFVMKMNRENIRTPARSVANVEFHHVGDESNAVAHKITRSLEELGVRAAFPAMAFPMEMSNWPNRIWVIAHKPVAVAAGLGRMGIHRNVIHPKFGNFILLGTVATDLEIEDYSRPLDFNPCLECKLCVAACPTGAIAPDGRFDFSACYTHNYREFMGGFSDWIENVVESKNTLEYRKRMSDPETISMWQSLAFGPNYKAAYCMAVCPAGDDVIGDYRSDKAKFLKEILDPLQKKAETIYVTPNSDAEDYVLRRFPHKQRKRVGSVLRPTSIEGFLRSLRLVFQRGKSAGLNAAFHFIFTGAVEQSATIVIANKELRVERGLVGKAQLTVTADSGVWIRFLRREANLPWAILRRKIRLRGDPRLLLAFGRCFPSG